MRQLPEVFGRPHLGSTIVALHLGSPGRAPQGLSLREGVGCTDRWESNQVFIIFL